MAARVFCTLFLLCFSAFAQALELDVYAETNGVWSTTYDDTVESRMLAMQAAFLASPERAHLPINTIVTFKYKDGSKEQGKRTSRHGSWQFAPIPGTGEPPPDNGGAGSGGGDGSGDGSNPGYGGNNGGWGGGSWVQCGYTNVGGSIAYYCVMT